MEYKLKRKIICALVFTATIILLGGTAVAGKHRTTYVSAAETLPAELVSSSRDTSRRFVAPDMPRIRSETESYISKQPGSSISLHFEYLPDHRTIDIEPDRSYLLMSLAKLPIIMLLFQQSEAGRVNLDGPVTVLPGDVDSSYGNLWLRGSGYQITPRQAVQLAIQDSDNTAIKLIRRIVISQTPSAQAPGAGLDVSKFFKVHPDGQTTDVKSYSQLLSCLYTSCQTSRQDSRAILSYMTHTHDSSIRDGSGHGATVADKFGIFEKPNQPHLYSDCGIVYTSNGNYILCIMAQNPTKSIRDETAALAGIIYRGVVPQH